MSYLYMGQCLKPQECCLTLARASQYQVQPTLSEVDESCLTAKPDLVGLYYTWNLPSCTANTISPLLIYTTNDFTFSNLLLYKL